MKTLTVVLASLMMGASVSADAAALGSEITQRPVSFADLDLSQDAGVEKLYGRIRAAARQVCQTSGILARLSPRTNECAKDALARAVAEVGAPLLTRYHDAQDSKRDPTRMRPAVLANNDFEHAGERLAE